MEEEHRRSAPTQSNARDLFTRMSFDKHLLERGFIDEQVGCCVLYRKKMRFFYLIYFDRLEKNYERMLNKHHDVSSDRQYVSSWKVVVGA